MMKADVPVAVEKPKIPLPTVSQINADRITQVNNYSNLLLFEILHRIL